jgi:glycosyltransferase involved in cell wall biosynthesis
MHSKCPTVAVIVPACNEEARIGGCLCAVLRNGFTGVLTVVVSVNGSSDRTAAAAGGFRSDYEKRGWQLTVLELPLASKVAALNAGDALVDADIRIYLDADAVLSENAIDCLAEVLSYDRPCLAAPRLCAVPGPGPLSRACASVWTAIPPISDDVAGGGCFAVNRAGRTRFADFPDLIADDGFVRSRFARSERVLVRAASYCVPFPDDDMIVKVWARWLQGNMELQHHGHSADDPAIMLRRARALVASPALWSKVPAYFLTAIQAHRLARKRFRAHERSWERALPPVTGPVNDPG